MNIRNRICAVLLSVVMVTSYMPALAFAMAEDVTDAPEKVIEDTQAYVNEGKTEEATATDSAEEDTLSDGAEEINEEDIGESTAPDHAAEGILSDGSSQIIEKSEENESAEENVPKVVEGNTPEEQPEEVGSDQQGTQLRRIITNTSSAKPDTDLSDSDELLWDYLDHKIKEETGSTKEVKSGKRNVQGTRGSALSGVDALLYDYLKGQIEYIIDPDEGDPNTSTVFRVPFSALLGKEEYPVDGVDVQDPDNPDETITIDARCMPVEDFEQFFDGNGNALFNLNNIVKTLAADLPYALYWYDKKEGTEVLLDPESYYSDGEYYYFEEAEGGSNPGLIFNFYVSPDYSSDHISGTTELDSSKRERANAAVENAVAMIQKTKAEALAQSLTASETNLYILNEYKALVCGSVTYDENSANEANEVPYGDPWQMISVFDGDPSTNVVCEGYSKAFQYLCDNTDILAEAGIKCYSVTGTMTGGVGEGPHMWNILHMDDGRNYMADVTNSDEDSAGENGGLFIAPAFGGSIEDGYGYMDADEDGNPEITYIYDEDTCRIYGDEELEMSTTAYGDQDEPFVEESVIPISRDERVSFTATHEKDYQIYSFTPEEEGVYCFESFGTVDTYGYSGSMDKGIFNEEISDDDGGEDRNFILYFDVSAGQTVYLKARTYNMPAEGSEETFEIQVTKSSRVESIEISLAEPLVVCEHTQGYWTFDSMGNSIWEYWFPGFSEGDTLTVTDGDSSVVYSYSEGRFRADGRTSIGLGYSSNQGETGEWEVGEHEFVVSYRGAEASIPIEITASPVGEIIFTPAKPMTYIEGVDGNTDTDQYDEEFTSYSHPWFRNGDTLNVDGTDYVFSSYSDQFISEDEDTINPNDIVWLDSDQYSNHWDIGRHEFVIGYMGKFTSYPVEVIENPVESIVYIPESPYIYYEGADCSTITDDGDTDHYLYELPYRKQGDKLIINGTDEYTFEGEDAFIGPEGSTIEAYEIQFSSHQEDGEYWEPGSSNYVTVTYSGRKYVVPVAVITPANVEISYQPEEFVLTENVDGTYHYHWDKDDNEISWFCYEINAAKGDILTVNDKEYTLRNGYYISADGERIDEAEVVFRTDQSFDNQWSIDDEGGHSVTISYKGAACTVPVSITATAVTGIEFVPSQPYRFYEHAGGYWDREYEGDEGTGESYYYYELPEYSEGDRLTVYKGEDSVDYFFRYDESSGSGAFYTEDGQDRIDRWDVERHSSQYDGEYWQPGGEYQITISYMGASCSIDVSVEDNPVESIEYEPAGGAFGITWHVNGYWDYEEEIFWYYSPSPQTGDRITLQMTSGDVTVYEFSEPEDGGCFTDISDDSNRLDMQYLSCYLDPQEDWEAGSTHECTVVYMGKECTADVTVAENPVTGFTVTLADTLRIRDTAFEKLQYYEDGFYPVTCIDGWDGESGRRLFRTGDYITVTSTKGTQRYTLRGENNYFDDGLGNRIYCSEIEIWTAGSWARDGDPQVVMSYMGRETDPVSVEIYPDPDHEHTLVRHDSVAAGCLTNGYTEFWYCQGCDSYFSDENGQHAMALEDAVISAAGHNWGTGTVTKEASCSEAGEMTYTCSLCGETRTQSIPAAEHSWNEGEVTQPSTCSWKGTKELTCEVCGATRTERLPLAPHAELLHVEAQEPTCTNYGHTEYWYCSDCERAFSDENGRNEIRVVYQPSIPHVLEAHPAEEATCESDGHEAYWECTECHSLFSDAEGEVSIDVPVTIDALGHDWSDWEEIAAPTCTENGTETRVCLRDSSHTETRETDALGHDWTGEPEYEWASDYSYVTATIHCSRDASHELSETVYTSCEDTATCTEGGIRTYTAEFVSEEFMTQTREVPSQPLGHDYCDVPDTAIEAGCESEGRTADRECSRCGDFIEGETVPAHGHDYQDIADTAVEAGCETEGRTADRRCSWCGDEIEGETVPAHGHDYHDITGTSVDAGCVTDGKKADRVCSRCNKMITGETIDALGHDLIKTDEKPATCTVNGNIEYWTCGRCGKLFRDEEGTIEISEADIVDAAEGHTWGEPVFTFSEDGTSATATRTCTIDPAHTETVDAVVTSEITKIATETEMGEITYTATAAFDGIDYTDTKIFEADTYVPQAINQLSAVGDTHKIRLAWTRSHEVNSKIYRIYRREALTDLNQLIKTINSRETLSYDDEDVADGKKYTYYVTCVNDYGQESDPSPEATAEAKSDSECPQVIQMSPADKAVIGGIMKITARATDNVQVTSVKLWISADNGSSWEELGESTEPSVEYNLDTSSYTSEKIMVKAIAYDAAENASDPFIREYTIDNAGPAPVKNLNAEASASSVTLTWDENEDADLSFYRVEQVSGNDITKIQDVNAAGILLNGLKSSTEYTYQVAAYDRLGNRGTTSDSVTITTSADDIAPEVISIEPASSYVAGELEISVKVRDNTGLKSAVIQYSTEETGWTDLETVEFDGSPLEATASKVINTTELEDGSLFIRAKVTDINGNVNDYMDMESTENIIDNTKPSKVSSLIAEAGAGSISLRWTKSEEDDLGGYNIYRSEDGEDFTLIAKTGNTTCEDRTANKPGQKYIYKVAAVDTAANIGELSDAAEADAFADTEAPVINAYEPASNSYIGAGNKTFTILASDNTELANLKITYTVDSTDDESDVTEEQVLYENNDPDDYYLEISGDLPVDQLKTGDVIKLHIYATDTAGNELTDNNEITYTADMTAPVVNSISAALGDNNQSVDLRISSLRTEDLAGYYIDRKENGGKYELLSYVAGNQTSDYDIYSYCDYTDTRIIDGHVYSYMAVAYDNCGNTGYRESEEIIVPDVVDLKAKLTLDKVMEGDVEYYFSGNKSESDLGIAEYSFDFGDGHSVTGQNARVKHRYPVPINGTDQYTVTLTITDNGGNTATTTQEVTVKTQALVGTVTVTVEDPNGMRLSNVPVYFDMDNTLDRVKYTDSKGQVIFTSDTGQYAVGAYTGNYLPVRKTINVAANTNNTLLLTMTEKELVTGNFEVRQLTLDEIRELGINTSDPDNLHYARINVKLKYGEVEAVVDQKDGIIKEIIKTIGKINIFPIVPDNDLPPIDWPSGGGDGGGDGGGGGGGGGHPFGNKKPEIPFVAVIEAPVEASFLKEFFDVRLHLLNNDSSGYEINDNMVKLNVPDGMTIMDLEQTEGEVVRFDQLKGQETKTIDWCLRGDRAGSYDLTADYSGVLKDFGANVKGQFKTSEPIKVLGLEAAKVIMEIDEEIRHHNFITTISLQNKGDADMYLPSVGIVDDMIKVVEQYTLKNIPTTSIRYLPAELQSTSLKDEDGNIKILYDNNTEVLSKGQMLSKRYECYNAIKSEEFAEFKDYCYEIAEGYGIDFELIVKQQDSHYAVTDEPSTGFKLGRDNNSYGHYYEGPGAGFYGMYNYNVDSSSLAYLMSKSLPDIRDVALVPMQSDAFAHGWCFGIAATIAGVFNNDLSISDISHSNASNYYSMDYPCNDKRLMNAINYYYLAGNNFRDSFTIASYNSSSDKYSGLTNYNSQREGDVSGFFKKLKSKLSNGKAVILTLPGHAIVAVGYKKTEDGHEFIVYDENSVGSGSPKGYYEKIYTNKDMSKFSWLHDGYTKTERNCGAISLLDSAKIVEEFPLLESALPEPVRWLKEGSETYIKLLVDPTDSSGLLATLIFEAAGGNLSVETINNYVRFKGNAAINRIKQLFNDNFDVETYLIAVDSIGDNPIKIVDIQGNVDISISDAAGAVAVRGSGIEEIDITLGKSLTIKGTDFTADATVSCYDEGNDTPVKLVSAELSSKGSTTITSNQDGITVEGNSTINNLTVENVEGMESIETVENSTVEPGEAVTFVTDERAAVDAAIEAINKLPQKDAITADSEDAITAAREAYDKLTDDQKAQVGQAALDKLKEAEAELDIIKKTRKLADAVEEAEMKADNAAQKAQTAEETAAALETAAGEAKIAADNAAKTMNAADIADAKAKAETAKTAQTEAQIAINNANKAKEAADAAVQTANTAIEEAKTAGINTGDAESRISAVVTTVEQSAGKTSAAENAKASADSKISSAESVVEQAEKNQAAPGPDAGESDNSASDDNIASSEMTNNDKTSADKADADKAAEKTATEQTSADKTAEQTAADKTAADAEDDKIAKGTTHTVGGLKYIVISPTAGTVALIKSKNKKSVTVPATVKLNGKSFKVTQINAKAFTGKKIRTVTIGKNVKVIKKNAFKGSKATKIILKTKLLKKAKVKGCLKGSKVKTIQIKIGKKSVNKKFVKKYKKFFTKANAGKKVKVK